MSYYDNGPLPSRGEMAFWIILLLALAFGFVWGSRPFCRVNCHTFDGHKYCCPIAGDQ